MMRLGIGLLTLALLVFGLSAIAAQSGSAPQILAMATTPRLVPPPTLQDYLDAFRLTHDLGIRGNAFTEKWSTFEPDNGGLQVAKFAEDTNGYLAFYPDTSLLGLQVLNTTAKETPADLLNVPFDDPQMLERFNALVDAMLAGIEHPIRYLSIGNEVDVYLAAHPDEWDTYKTFYDGAVAHVHEVAPEIQVGVTVTYSGLLAHTDKIMRLNEASDVFILTYYPLGAGFTADNPEAPLTDFPRMTELAGGLPVVLQEVGYPSADLLGSSEAEQAQFVRSVFSAWKTAGSAIPFLDYFLLHDFNEELCSSLETYYGLKHPSFHAYLCTLGLRQANGTPKAAWQAFVDEATAWREGTMH